MRDFDRDFEAIKVAIYMKHMLQANIDRMPAEFRYCLPSNDKLRTLDGIRNQISEFKGPIGLIYYLRYTEAGVPGEITSMAVERHVAEFL